MRIFKITLLHVLYIVGFVLLYSPDFGIITRETYEDKVLPLMRDVPGVVGTIITENQRKYFYFHVHLAVLGYVLLFMWSLLVFLFYKRTIIGVIEGVFGFFFTALATLGVGRELLFIMGEHEGMKHDEMKLAIVNTFAIFFHITTLSVLLAPLLSNWWKRKREKIINKWKRDRAT